CGSADLLERLGFKVEMEPLRVQESIERIGIGFMFAPAFHPAMKRVAPVRRELGIRTVFNLLGPLINPARVDAQLVGVYSPELVPLIAEVLSRLRTEEAIVANAAAARVVARRATTFPEGVELAKNSILGGAAYKKLEELVKFSGGEPIRFEEYAKSR